MKWISLNQTGSNLSGHGLDKHGLDKHGLNYILKQSTRNLGLTFNLVGSQSTVPPLVSSL